MRPKATRENGKRRGVRKVLDMIAQAWLAVFGMAAIWFVGRREKWSRIGFILGLSSQPAWIITSIMNEQWGILALSLWYTYSWIQGIYNNFSIKGGNRQ